MALLTVNANSELKTDGKRYEVAERFKMPRISGYVLAGSEFKERNDGWFALFNPAGVRQFYTLSADQVDRYIDNLKEIAPDGK